MLDAKLDAKVTAELVLVCDVTFMLALPPTVTHRTVEELYIGH
jgi:hypothetical protein